MSAAAAVWPTMKPQLSVQWSRVNSCKECMTSPPGKLSFYVLLQIIKTILMNEMWRLLFYSNNKGKTIESHSLCWKIFLVDNNVQYIVLIPDKWNEFNWHVFRSALHLPHPSQDSHYQYFYRIAGLLSLHCDTPFI